MIIINGWLLIAQIALWLLGTVAAAVVFSYFWRPRTRALYPGGGGRYLLALVVQATAFIVPIPVVLVLLLGAPIPNMLQVVLAVAAGVGVVMVARSAPGTGALLRDLHRARVAAAAERLERKA